MAAKQPKRAKRNQEEFYEMMPGGAYMESYELFPSRTFEEDEAEAAVDPEQAMVQRNAAKQVLMLIGLLVVQVILFALLIQAATNLG